MFGIVIDDDILMESSEKVQFGSTSDYIHVTGSNLTSIAAADYVVDAASEIMLDYGAGTDGIVFKEAGTIIGSLVKSYTSTPLITICMLNPAIDKNRPIQSFLKSGLLRDKKVRNNQLLFLERKRILIIITSKKHELK